MSGVHYGKQKRNFEFIEDNQVPKDEASYVALERER